MGVGTLIIVALLTIITTDPLARNSGDDLVRVPIDVAAVIRDLGQGGAGREAAVLAIIRHGRQLGPAFADAVPSLRRLIRDPDADRIGAATALGQIGPAAKDAVPDLMNLMDAEDHILSGVAMTSIRRIGPAAIPFVDSRLNDPNPGIRGRAVWLLGFIGKGRVTPYFSLSRHLLFDPDVGVRMNASHGLARFGWIAAIPLWLATFDTDGAVIESAGELSRKVWQR
jgi:hypothetical protein